ncbi:MAG: twin-arginine translocase TatA/TatE family subunit [Candidatus Eisenbacteria sp.]|nr:twin-arginine translocase TatA/TatE family subunit [Candidatus Eisenbacteria bacterium]
MFGIGTQEILVILLVMLLLFGGKRIPELARILGKGMGDFRRAARDVQREIDLEILKEPVGRVEQESRSKRSGKKKPPAAAQGNSAGTVGPGASEKRGSGDTL